MTSQTPEETHNTREEIEEILYAPNLNITQGEYRTFIDEVVPKIVSTLLSQQQKHREELQKAREKGYESIIEVVNDLKQQWGGAIDLRTAEFVESETKRRIIKNIRYKMNQEHSELDQDTELLNSVKEDWDKQAKNAMNGLDQDVSK